ncbi:MAG: hypothetical protein ABIL09_27230, partial [Gemmatimonadota bacterium]
MGDRQLHLGLRHQELRRDERGRAYWEPVTEDASWPAAATGLLLCDVWDRHWSRGATERVEAMVGAMDRLVRAARDAGVQIVHAPSDTMDFYAGNPARQRVQEAAAAAPPRTHGLPAWLAGADAQLCDRLLPGGIDDAEARRAYDPPLPVDAGDQGSDTGETETHKAWSRQHPGIGIDADRDGISDRGEEIYRFLRGRGVAHLLIMGVHTNMCVLGRSFAIR